MSYTQVATARDRNKRLIRVGSKIRYYGYGEVINTEPEAVTVVGMHKQGANGIILTTDPAPNPDYPHHFGCRASKVEVVA
jgi:hypothetical protein